MSWECHCPGAVERAREHMPGSYRACPYCGRTRDHVELLEAVRGLLELLDAKAPDVLGSLRWMVMDYLGDQGKPPPGDARQLDMFTPSPSAYSEATAPAYQSPPPPLPPSFRRRRRHMKESES